MKSPKTPNGDNNITYNPPGSDIVIQNIVTSSSKAMYFKMACFVTQEGIFQEFNLNVNMAEGVSNKHYLLQAKSIKIGNILIKMLKEKFQFESEAKFYSVPVDKDKQIPEYVGSFEYNKKLYCIVYICNAITKETNPDKGIYKGIILDPISYFGDGNNGDSDTNSRVRDLLK